MKIFVFFFAFAVALYGAPQDEIPVTRWVGNSQPGTYEEWIAQHPYTDFYYKLDKVALGDGRQGTIAILTDSTIANHLTGETNQFINNLQQEGYTVLSYQVSGGEPETLRTFLQGLYNTESIEGALFVGDITVAWFEVSNDHDTYGYAQFPMDLYYMDLDGTWLDTMNTGNGRFDGHTGNLNPEIYIGRLIPPANPDTAYLKTYFRKNNAFKRDSILLNQRALFFIDDDWIPWAYQWSYDVSLVFPDTINYCHPETTRALIYRQKLDTAYAWVSLFAHSNSSSHSFTYNNGNSTDTYWANEYTTQDPPANLYNFFCCSFSRYTDYGYGGGRATFNPTYCVGSIGSSKTGSMLEFYYFYYPLSQGKTWGEAFKDWFTYITNNGVTYSELCWHYGMTIIGDPWLLPTGHHLAVEETKIDIVTLKELTILGNPVSKELNLMFSLGKKENVKISLYDCAGRKVTNLMNRTFESGNHNLRCMLNDNTGNALPQGVYILRFEAGDNISTRKIVKI